MFSQKAVLEPPSKFISNEVTVQLACRLLFVDMEGLNDGRAVKAIVPKVEPRKLVRCQQETAITTSHKYQILVHGSSEDTDALMQSCSTIKNMTKEIFAPASLETIQIGQKINSFSISISDTLLGSVQMSRVRVFPARSAFLTLCSLKITRLGLLLGGS